MRSAAIFFSLTLVVPMFFSQTPLGVGGGIGSGARVDAAPVMTNVVQGAPYSADEVVQDVQKLADGEQIAREPMSAKLYRDSVGRTRREYTPSRDPLSRAIDINDPVALVKYTLDTDRKVAHRQRLRVVGEAAAVTGPDLTRPGTQPERSAPEQLGTQSIEGLLCEGTRVTTTWPVGSRGNNKQPLVIIDERWRSRELRLIVLSRTDNGQAGQRMLKLMNIDRAEPAADLFKPPSDYAVVDEPDSFSTSRATGGAMGSDGVYRMGGDVTSPVIISKTEPTFSDEARQAKYSGTVLLSLVVGKDGIPRDIKVIRPLGLGLDENAIKAVERWRFQPGKKQGEPVMVRVTVEVNFRLR